jgi:multidrug efflux pump subunit AcrA (membrane-fusion protein)
MKGASGKRIRVAAVAVVITTGLSFSGYRGYRAWSQLGVEAATLTMTLQPRDFTIQISANGELQSAESMAIAVPPVPVNQLRIASVVPDGRYVNKGDVLVEFDRTEIDLQVLEDNFDLKMANQKINKSEMAVGGEKSDIVKDRKIAEMELAKISEFQPKNEDIFSYKEIVEGQLDKDYAAKRVVFADARLELKGKVYSLDEAILMLERQKATSKISQAERALASLKLVSPGAGLVVYNDPGYYFGGRQLTPGGVVYIGMNLFNLVNPNKMEARLYVLEKDAGELRADEVVTVTLDPFPGSSFTGKVKSIDKLARPLDRDSPVKYFQTMVSLDSTDPALMKPGVKVKANITAGELKDVLVVPRSAVVKRDQDLVTYVEKGPNRFEPVPVTVGQGDLIQVVVTQGLESGQAIALNPPDVKREFSPGAKKTGS